MTSLKSPTAGSATPASSLHNVTDAKTDPPANILSHAPYKDKDGKDKDYVYHQPTQGRIGPERSMYEIDFSTVPQRLDMSTYWFDAEELARETWGERKELRDLLSDQRKWVYEAKKTAEKRRDLSEDASSRQMSRHEKDESTEADKQNVDNDAEPTSKRRKFETEADNAASENRKNASEDNGGIWDEDALDKAWLAFEEPLDDRTCALMGQVLRDKHGLSVAPPLDLLKRMREYRETSVKATEKVFERSADEDLIKNTTVATSRVAEESCKSGRDTVPKGLADCMRLIEENLARLHAKSQASDRG
ncbi:hypothetical protein OPT61_g6707 [Boeremia exigua]|uniref:Uncharacterized protein n=1 Tax=Boeremia exigua TaxID=749465 RepID=A0ACC2I680_9PLEO|nr:hypothetical protein OPT61_g6707 [Boeremia exigua]